MTELGGGEARLATALAGVAAAAAGAGLAGVGAAGFPLAEEALAAAFAGSGFMLAVAAIVDERGMVGLQFHLAYRTGAARTGGGGARWNNFRVSLSRAPAVGVAQKRCGRFVELVAVSVGLRTGQCVHANPPANLALLNEVLRHARQSVQTSRNSNPRLGWQPRCRGFLAVDRKLCDPVFRSGVPCSWT
jgi:hypothetical protein